MSEVKCKGCGKKPEEIPEYVAMGQVSNTSPEEVVRREEGTFNPKTGAFYCTKCYIRVGMPLGVA